MQDLVLDDVTKRWDDGSAALDHLDLHLPAGELVGLVGPSGCGKTTALRIIAGLEQPTSGRVLLGPRDITDDQTRERHFGLVTQQNQLLGHLSAARNISFPLEVRGEIDTVGEIDRRLGREAARLGIEDLLERRPRSLSEGQRRLVQLARAVIGAPVALLMDEPLAFLEDQIRLRLRSDILRVHRDRGLTSLLVTASQQDTFAVCDRVAVLIDGRLEQYAPPSEVYHRPATTAVARFFGDPEMNLLRGRVHASGGSRRIRLLDRSIPIGTSAVDRHHGQDVWVGIRPHDLVIGGAIDRSIEVRVELSEPMGHETWLSTSTRDGLRLAVVAPGLAPRLGTVLDLGIPPDRVHVFDVATGMGIYHPAV